MRTPGLRRQGLAGFGSQPPDTDAAILSEQPGRSEVDRADALAAAVTTASPAGTDDQNAAACAKGAPAARVSHRSVDEPQRPRTTRRVVADVGRLDGPRTSQVNFATSLAIRRHISLLVFELQQDGLRTSQSELLSALVAFGPASCAEARTLIEDFRDRRHRSR
jgi:hypothetical protein